MKKFILGFILFVALQATAQQSGIGVSFLGTDYYSVQKNKMTLYLQDSSWFKTYDPGARISYVTKLSRWFDLQGNLNYSHVDLPGSTNDSAFILRRWDGYRGGQGARKNYVTSLVEADVRLNLSLLDRAKWIASPYLFSGISGSMGSNYFGATLPAGAGVNVKLLKNLSLNAEASKRFALTNSPEFDRFQYALGLIFWNGAKKSKAPVVPVVAKVVDRDGDGINDDVDACPDVAGSSKLSGCPDRDGDGIADKDDKCPLVAGTPKYYGCPIPDTDNDGINDEADKCPSVSGLSKYNGCPIPDTDGDGFNDEVDRCPKVASATNFGCPEIKADVINKVKKAAGSVFFDTNKSTIKKESLKQLDLVAAIMKEDATLKIDIAGHTDASGDAAKNTQLSKDRAKACLDYLVSKGIDASRLTSEGYGSSVPVADNATPAGRAKNRRTEFSLKNY